MYVCLTKAWSRIRESRSSVMLTGRVNLSKFAGSVRGYKNLSIFETSLVCFLNIPTARPWEIGLGVGMWSEIEQTLIETSSIRYVRFVRIAKQCSVQHHDQAIRLHKKRIINVIL